MVISHGPEKINQSHLQKDPVSEIQLFNGEGLFKKKKRKYNRDSLGMNLNYHPPSQQMDKYKGKMTLND